MANATLDDVLAEISYQEARMDALEGKISGLQEKEREATQKAARTPEERNAADQAKIDEAMAALKRNRERQDTIIASTTPRAKRTPQPGEPGYGVPGQPGYVPPGQPRYVAANPPGTLKPGEPGYVSQPGLGRPPQEGEPGYVPGRV